MSFVTPLLLAGVGLVALPVILHLVMRRQPRVLQFPALRFVQQRRDANRRRVKLRHLLLLAMRCLLVAALAVALARPTLRGSGLRGEPGAPLAVAVVVDNSLRMTYVRDSQTRLELAAEMAGELIKKLPEETSISVIDLGSPSSGFVFDRSAAQARLKNLRAVADARPLGDAVEEAIRLAAEQEDHRQEVFVLTDLAKSAWDEETAASIAQALEAAPDVQIYVLDAGVDEPRNVALGDAELQSSILLPGESLHAEVTVEATDDSDEAPLVELLFEDEDGEFVKRDQRVATADASGKLAATFELAGLSLGTHQGKLALIGGDPLAMDDARYFSVEVREPARVLIWAKSKEAALFVREALSPSLLDQPPRFLCEVQTFDQADAGALAEVQAAILLDPPPLADALWSALLEFAESGGGAAVCLGHNAELSGMNSQAAQRLLPGPLKTRARDATYLRPRRLDHPSLTALRDFEESILWPQSEVFTYWEFADRHADAYVVARFANNEPAVIERRAGRGRVLTWATPLSDPLQPRGRDPWNVLPAQAWPYVALCNEMTGYLAQSAGERLNYFAGETVRVPVDRRRGVSKYILKAPDGQRQRRTSPPGEPAVVLSTTDRLGNYRVTAGGDDGLDRGFSVNVPAALSDLTRVDSQELAKTMPDGQFEIAETLADAEAYVDIGRSGRELFPWLIFAVSLVWGAEHLLANRFYEAG
ncbi:BatA domain-containing protein [Pirellulales bacterium]|nr:BatA domain-containing protein [Pirellulales bacterium]